MIAPARTHSRTGPQPAAPYNGAAMRGLRFLGAGVLLAFLAVAFTPLANALASRLAEPAALGGADAIVVLGAGLGPAGSLSDASLRRFVHGIRLYRRGLAPVLAFTGGPAIRRRPEAELRAALAREIGVPAADVVIVPAARTTREEARRVREDLGARGVHRILLVTGATHMARARALFVKAGFAVQAAPITEAAVSPEERIDLMRRLLQEVAARGYYRLAGWL